MYRYILRDKDERILDIVTSKGTLFDLTVRTKAKKQMLAGVAPKARAGLEAAIDSARITLEHVPKV